MPIANASVIVATTTKRVKSTPKAFFRISLFIWVSILDVMAKRRRGKDFSQKTFLTSYLFLLF